MWWSNKMPKHLPLATGPYVPGCMDVMKDYSEDGLFMRLFYPTNAEKSYRDSHKKWISWMPDDSYIVGFAKVLMTFTFFIRLALWWSANIHIPALYGEKPRTKEKLKCIILSHGLGGHRFLYTNVCCELASHGYLVAAIEHRDSSACHTYYYASRSDAKNDIKASIDYRVIQFGQKHYDRRNAQINQRAEECSKVVDFLIDVNKGCIPENVINEISKNKKVDFDLEDLIGNLDMDNLTMAGHSFGGATALLTMSKRNELKQGVLLDPWMFPIKEENLVEKVKQPLLFINTKTFHIASNVEAMSKYLTSDDRNMYTILHTTHENQTDSVLLVGYWLNWFMKKLNPLTALKINNSLILTWLSNYVKSSVNLDDCRNYLEEQSENIQIGLTKPWA